MNTFIKTESQSELPSIELTKLEHVALIGCHNYEKFVTFLPSVIDCEMLRLLCAEVHRSHHTPLPHINSSFPPSVLISIQKLCRGLHGMDFHGRGAPVGATHL